MTEAANAPASNSIQLIQQFQKQTEHPRVPDAARRTSELSKKSLLTGSQGKLNQDNVVKGIQYQNSVGVPKSSEVALKGSFMQKMNQTGKKLQRKLRGRGDSQVETVPLPVASQGDQEETPTQPSITPTNGHGIEGENGYNRVDSEVIAMSELPPGKVLNSSGFDEGLFYEDNIASETEVINDQDLYNTPQGPAHQRVGSNSNLQREIDMILASNVDERIKQKMIEDIEQKHQRYRGKKTNIFQGAPIKSSKHADTRSKTTNKKKKKYANQIGELAPNEIFFQDQDGRDRRQYVNAGDSFAGRSMAHHVSDPRFESADNNLRKKAKTKKARKGKHGVLQSAKANRRAEADGQNKKYLLPEVSEFQNKDYNRDHDYLTQDEMNYYTNQHVGLGRKLKSKTKRVQKKTQQSTSRSPSISPRGPNLHTAKRTRARGGFNMQDQQSSNDEGPKPRNYYMNKGFTSPKAKESASNKQMNRDRCQSGVSLQSNQPKYARVNSSLSRDVPYKSNNMKSEASPAQSRKLKDSIEHGSVHGSSKFIKQKGFTPGRIRVSEKKQAPLENLPNVNRQLSQMVNGIDKRKLKANKMNRLYDTAGPTTMQPIQNRSDSMPRIDKQQSNYTSGPFDRATDLRPADELPYMTPVRAARKSRDSLPSDAKSYRHGKASNRGKVQGSYTSQGKENPYDRKVNNNDFLSNSINFEKKGLVGVPGRNDQSHGQFYNSGKSWKGTLGPSPAEASGFPVFGAQTPGEMKSNRESLENTIKSGNGVAATGKWGGDTPMMKDPIDSKYQREPTVDSLRGEKGMKSGDISKSREPSNMYEWDLDGRRHVKGTIPKVNIGNLIKSMHSQKPGEIEHKLVQARNSKLMDSHQSSAFHAAQSQSLQNPKSEKNQNQVSRPSEVYKLKEGRETPAHRIQGGIHTQPIQGRLILKKERTAPSVTHTDHTKRQETLSPNIQSFDSRDRSSVSPDEGLAPSCAHYSQPPKTSHQPYDTQSHEAYQLSQHAKSNKTGRGPQTDMDGHRYTSKNVGSSHILRSQKTPKETLLTSASKGSRRVLIEDNFVQSSGASNRSDSESKSQHKSSDSRSKFVSHSQKAKTAQSNKTRSSMVRPEDKKQWDKKRESSISPEHEGLSAYDSSLTPVQRDSLSVVMKVAARKSSDTEASPTKKLMKELTNYSTKIDDDTALLINGKELLTKEGIKGKIAQVGVGFGTGRHTSGRRSVLPEIIEKVSPLKKSNSKSRKTLGAQTQGPYIPIVKETLEEATQTPPAPSIRLPNINKPQMVSTGCDPQSVKNQNKSIGPKTLSAQSIGLSARTASPAPELASVGLQGQIESLKSVRDALDQVTEGRFDPLMESANVQTDAELLERLLAKETAAVETNTDPVTFEKKIKYGSTMVQTDPIVSEDKELLVEPSGLAMPVEPIDDSQNENSDSANSLKQPTNEEPFVLQIPQPQEPEDDKDLKDWAKSSLYEYVKQNSFSKLVKRGLISQEDIESERPDTPASQKGMSLKERQDYNLNPLQLNILTPMECEYGQALMRKKSTTFCSPEERKDLFERAKTTIEVLTANMVRPDLCSNIMYQHYTECNNKNTIKLLIRCRKLYDARVEVITILKNIIEAEELIKPKSAVYRVMLDDSDKPLDERHFNLIMKTLDQLSRNLMMITIFQTEQLLFSNEFYFNKVEYRESMRLQGEILSGFLQQKEKDNPALQLNGYLARMHEHDEHNAQTKAYKEWLSEALEKHGKLDLPDDKALALLNEKGNKGLSRVALAIANMPPEKKKSDVRKEKKQKPRLTDIMPEESEFVQKSPSQQYIERSAEPWKREASQFEIQASAVSIQQETDGSAETNNKERSIKSKLGASGDLELKSRNPAEGQLIHTQSQATDLHLNTAKIGRLNFASDFQIGDGDKTDTSELLQKAKMPRYIAHQRMSDAAPQEYSDNTGAAQNAVGSFGYGRETPDGMAYQNEYFQDQPRSTLQSYQTRGQSQLSNDIEGLDLKVKHPLQPNKGIKGRLGEAKKSESIMRESGGMNVNSTSTMPQGLPPQIMRTSEQVPLSQRSEFTVPHDCSEKIKLAYSDAESGVNITELNGAVISDVGSQEGSQIFNGLKQNSRDQGFNQFKSTTSIPGNVSFRAVEESDQDDLATQNVNKDGVRLIERSETPMHVE